MEPRKLDLLLVPVRSERVSIVLCRIAGLHSVDTSPCIARTFIGREGFG